MSGGRIYIQKDILLNYPEVKVDKANSIINKTDNKTYYLVTNPNKIETGRQLDSFFKASSTRGLTPDEKIEQKRKREQQIQKFKDELEKLGNPTRYELRFKHNALYQKMWKANLLDDFFSELSPEEKHEKLISYFKDELEKLGNPTRYELRNKDYSLWLKIWRANLLDDFFPKLSPEEKFKDELEKLGNPSKSELRKNHDNLYQRIIRAGLVDDIFPKLSPEEKFKNELEKLGNPTKSELRNKDYGLWQKIWRAGLVDYFFPKKT
jgi:hypothetical protein